MDDMPGAMALPLVAGAAPARHDALVAWHARSGRECATHAIRFACVPWTLRFAAARSACRRIGRWEAFGAANGTVASRVRRASRSGYVRSGSGSVTASPCTAVPLAGAEGVTDGTRPARSGPAECAARALATCMSCGAARGQTAFQVTGAGCVRSGMHGDGGCSEVGGAEGSDCCADTDALSRSSGPHWRRSSELGADASGMLRTRMGR